MQLDMVCFQNQNKVLLELCNMKINNLELKNAETTTEKKMLGVIHSIAQNINYGNIKIDITVSKGKVVKMSVIDNTTIVLLD